MKEYRYHTLTDDVVQSKHQDYQMPDDYVYIRTAWRHRLAGNVIYRLFQAVGWVYLRCHLHTRFYGTERLKAFREQGFFLYGNHTQPFGDVVQVMLLCGHHRACGVFSPANFGIPVIGKLLPLIGALPNHRPKALTEAITTHIQQGHVVAIYPEGHVWPFYTQLRPFPDTAFHFPVSLHAPSFTMTAVYRPYARGKCVQQEVYIDGPFYPPEEMTPRQQRAELCKQVRSVMEQRLQNSSQTIVKYVRQGE
ncbi:MAG: lysophospholipid acyltransferase family protein [Candidatus Limimorpha sp.]